MRNIFYFIAAVIAFGAAFYYYQDVSQQTATVLKLRLVAEDGLVIEAGTVIDDEFLETYVVSQEMPRALAAEFGWALDDTAVTRINLRDQVFGQDVTGGSFLQRGHFFVDQQEAFALRIRDGYRAFSIPVATDRAVENFLNPGSLVDVVGAFEITPKVFESRILLENVEVMAVDDIDTVGEFETRDRPEYNSVTLQAPAAQVVQFAADSEAATGALSLLLRNPCENTENCIEQGSVSK